MEKSVLTKCKIVLIHTGLLADSFYLLVGATLSLIFDILIFEVKNLSDNQVLHRPLRNG